MSTCLVRLLDNVTITSQSTPPINLSERKKGSYKKWFNHRSTLKRLAWKPFSSEGEMLREAGWHSWLACPGPIPEESHFKQDWDHQCGCLQTPWWLCQDQVVYDRNSCGEQHQGLLLTSNFSSCRTLLSRKLVQKSCWKRLGFYSN